MNANAFVYETLLILEEDTFGEKKMFPVYSHIITNKAIFGGRLGGSGS